GGLCPELLHLPDGALGGRHRHVHAVRGDDPAEGAAPAPALRSLSHGQRLLFLNEGGIHTSPALRLLLSSFSGLFCTIRASIRAPMKHTAASIFLFEPRPGLRMICPYLPMNERALRRCAPSPGCPSQDRKSTRLNSSHV